MSDIKPEEFIIESWGKGAGIYMDGTYNAKYGVKVIYVPLGWVATCDIHKSQLRNKQECMKQLNERLKELTI